MSSLARNWWSREYWKILFTVKYRRHRKLVQKRHRELKAIYPEKGWFELRAKAWYEELVTEMGEGWMEVG